RHSKESLLEHLTQHIARRHRRKRHAFARGSVNGNGKRCHRRHNGYLAYPTDTIRMARIRHLHHDGVDHRQLKPRRHAIIEKAGSDHITIIVVDNLFVQGPTNALHRPTLNLAFSIAWMDGSPNVLHRGVAQDGDLASIGIDLDIHDMRGEGATH